MVGNNAIIDNAKVNYEFLCDLKTLDKVWLVLPPLKTMQRCILFVVRHLLKYVNISPTIGFK
jgi:hypothetical protein